METFFPADNSGRLWRQVHLCLFLIYSLKEILQKIIEERILRRTKGKAVSVSVSVKFYSLYSSLPSYICIFRRPFLNVTSHFVPFSSLYRSFLKTSSTVFQTFHKILQGSYFFQKKFVWSPCMKAKKFNEYQPSP